MCVSLPCFTWKLRLLWSEQLWLQHVIPILCTFYDSLLEKKKKKSFFTFHALWNLGLALTHREQFSQTLAMCLYCHRLHHASSCYGLWHVLKLTSLQWFAILKQIFIKPSDANQLTLHYEKCHGNGLKVAKLNPEFSCSKRHPAFQSNREKEPFLNAGLAATLDFQLPQSSSLTESQVICASGFSKWKTVNLLRTCGFVAVTILSRAGWM